MYQHFLRQLNGNKQRIKAVNNLGILYQIYFCSLNTKKSCIFFIFCPILTNFLPKCRAQNVDSKMGQGAGKKGMVLEQKGMAL